MAKSRKTSLLSRLGERIGRVFGRKVPKIPLTRRRRAYEDKVGRLVTPEGEIIDPGHRGVAARDLKKPDLSPENQAKWITEPPSWVASFVYDGALINVHSSNVSHAQYLIAEGKMIVGFKNGSEYEYGNISEEEAMIFAQAASKGVFVWDFLRVRGTKRGHRKPYRRVTPGQRIGHL